MKSHKFAAQFRHIRIIYRGRRLLLTIHSTQIDTLYTLPDIIIRPSSIRCNNTIIVEATTTTDLALG